jgi:hypothetical protein
VASSAGRRPVGLPRLLPPLRTMALLIRRGQGVIPEMSGVLAAAWPERLPVVGVELLCFVCLLCQDIIQESNSYCTAQAIRPRRSKVSAICYCLGTTPQAIRPLPPPFSGLSV